MTKFVSVVWTSVSCDESQCFLLDETPEGGYES